MTERVRNLYHRMFGSNHHERRKLFLLAFSFFFVIGAYSVMRPLKSSVFSSFVGTEWQPWTKIISIAMIFPCMFFYSFLIDRVRRYQVYYFFTGLYVVLGILFALLLAHPVMGVANTSSSSSRLLGWFFYIYMDFFPIFIVSTFWAFTNSVCNSETAKRDYGVIVAISKLGGVLLPYLALLLLHDENLDTATKIPFLLLGSTLLLLISIGIMSWLVRTVPRRNMHGYEAAYRADEAQRRTRKKTGVLEGIKLMITTPYVFGMFLLVYSYEIIAAMIDYQMQLRVQLEYAGEILGITDFNLWYTMAWQGLGLLFALLGTSTLLRWIGVRYCLMSVPFIIAVFVALVCALPTLGMFMLAMIVFRAVNYGFNQPVREILYIPTTKDIKFKSKGWIDSFGRNLSKTSGAAFNILSQTNAFGSTLFAGCSFSFLIAIVWMVTAGMIAKTYTRTIKNRSVIGTGGTS